MLNTANSKEVIKNRMLKHALMYWGIKNGEDLDPVVKLILESLSQELYNLGNEIKDTQVRMLEKVANLLAPDSLTSADPSHGILYVSPLEHTELLAKTTSFFVQKKISSRQNDELDTNLDIFFTPLGAVQILNVQLAYTVTGGTLYSYGPTLEKQFVTRSHHKLVDNNVIWLGLRTNSALENIKNLRFYFDFKNIDSKLSNSISNLLQLAKWYIEDMEIRVREGIQYEIPSQDSEASQNIFSSYDLMSLKEKDINDFYHHKFISVLDPCGKELKESQEKYPRCFENIFSSTELQKLNEKLLWIRIELADAMPQQYLSELSVYPNALPIMNRKLAQQKYRLKGGSNIIPLRTEFLEQFLAVHSLSDEVRQYRSVPYRQREDEKSGTYTLRNGGVERFDNRNAKEMIGYLLELIRSESAAFSAYGYDFIANTLKELNQKISLMEQKTRGHLISGEIPNYIVVTPYEGQDLMYAEYWTTLAEAANNLRAGSRLQLTRGAKVVQDSIMLMTTTIGGKNRLKPEEKLNAFRYGLLTRNRIVTREDIRSFCYHELGESICNVEVTKGFEMSFNGREAFRRTIDVLLTPALNNKMDLHGWDLVCEQFRSKLQSRSGVSNYYRVMVEGVRFKV